MGEIDKKEIRRIVGIDNKEEHLQRKLRITSDGKQYRVAIPKLFAETLDLDPEKDYFLSTMSFKDNEYFLTLELHHEE